MRILIVQPYIPAYRVPFFMDLTRRLERVGVETVIAAGDADPQQSQRRDSAALPNLAKLPEWRLALGGRSVVFRSVEKLLGGVGLVVLEQARRNTEAYRLLLKPRGRGFPIALWGHGATQSRSTSRTEDLLLDMLTRRSDWFFAYTDAGARHVRQLGFPGERVTVVRNSTDVTSLRLARAAIGDAEIQEMSRRYGLTPGRTGLYVGGLDSSKRISFLLEAVDRVRQHLPGFRLLVAGRGPEEHLVRGAEARGTARWLKHVTGGELALAGAAADVLLIPGRVGLVAVDSFALGIPILTTDWPYHAPEFEYLTPGQDSVVTPDSIECYADAIVNLLRDETRLKNLSERCATRACDFSVSAMASRFADGVQACLNSGPRRPNASAVRRRT